MNGSGLGGWKARALLAAGLGALAAAGLLLATTRVEVEGRWRGLFLLSSRDGRMLELQDDLYLGDGARLLAGVSFSRLRRWLGVQPPAPPPGAVALTLDFDEQAGRGLVRNQLADGRELVTIFGRYEDDDGAHPQGLFVGGAATDVATDQRSLDQSGMALHEPRGWFHVWCSVNEAVMDMDSGKVVAPGAYRFLGSRVLVADAGRVVLESHHEITLGSGGRLRMDRFAYFAAGEPYFKLGIRVTALGPGPIHYTYLYGDEPWVGHFGTAEGNVGWVEGQVLPHEQRLDPARQRWGGILDLKSGHANYLEWLGEDLPDSAYVSNQMGRVASAAARVPLESNEVFFGLQWRNRTLAPGEGHSMRLAIGLAERDPASGLPRRPAATAGP